MCALLLGAVLNIGLDPLFIYTFNSVSYTHLDVYKRQLKHRIVCYVGNGVRHQQQKRIAESHNQQSGYESVNAIRKYLLSTSFHYLRRKTAT